MNKGKLFTDDTNMPRNAPYFRINHDLSVPAQCSGSIIELSTMPLMTFVAKLSPMSILIVVIHELFHYYHNTNEGQTSQHARDTFRNTFSTSYGWNCLEETITCVRTLRVAQVLGIHAQYNIGHRTLWLLFFLFNNAQCNLNYFNTCYCDNVTAFQRHILNKYRTSLK